MWWVFFTSKSTFKSQFKRRIFFFMAACQRKQDISYLAGVFLQFCIMQKILCRIQQQYIILQYFRYTKYHGISRQRLNMEFNSLVFVTFILTLLGLAESGMHRASIKSKYGQLVTSNTLRWTAITGGDLRIPKEVHSRLKSEKKCNLGKL